MKVRTKKHSSLDRRIMSILGYTILTLMSFIALYPFLILISSSFDSEHSVINNGYRLLHKVVTLDAYKIIFKNPGDILNSYKITIFVTVFGTILALLFGSMCAYVLFRKEVYYRNRLAFFLYFTELFNGGLASYYIIVSKNLHLKNTLAVLLLVPMFSVFNLLILRNFIKSSIPYSLIESAKIDSANDWQIYWRVILPLAKPALASIGLFIALAYWNDWWTPMMFIEKEKLYPLQYTLYRMLSTSQMSSAVSESSAVVSTPTQTLKLAMTVIATGPIIFLYPFVQKYFVAGITIGSVKE